LDKRETEQILKAFEGEETVYIVSLPKR